MGLRDIPVVGIGPGSQPVEEDGAQLDYLEMPQGMNAYRKPILPEPKETRHLGDAMEVMDWLEGALSDYREGDEARSLDISTLDPDNRELVNQILGEGEVSVRYDGDPPARIQESVLAGVWRSMETDDAGRVTSDRLEICDIPRLTREMGAATAWPAIPAGTDAPPETMNAMPLLTEMREKVAAYRPGAAAHVINLTLLPLSPGDVAFLESVLGRGPVSILSRGYGNCRIDSTAIANIWWVRYYNSMDKLILDTLEVVDVPIVARAAPEDIESSAIRLREILEPYRSP